MEQLDPTDLQILHILQQDGRISNADLAQRIGLTPPTVLRRVKLLEERGYIKGYAALVDPIRVGLTVTAFIMVEPATNYELDELTAWFASVPEVQEVHRLIGEWCYLLKVRTQNPQTLENLVHRVLLRHPAVRRTHTILATSAPYETVSIPLPAPDATGAAIDHLEG